MKKTTSKMDGIQIIAVYEEIMLVTGKMLVAAKNSNWDELAILEKECSVLTEQLINTDSKTVLSDELIQKKVKILHQVLNDDAKIRTITEPWMERLKFIR